MDLGEKYRDINGMVEYFTNLYRSGCTSYTVHGQPSDMGCTNMTISNGRHSYYILATNDRIRVESLGLKPFPDQVIKFDEIDNMEYNDKFIEFKYGRNQLHLDLITYQNTGIDDYVEDF